MSLLQLEEGHLTNLSRGQPGVSVPPPPPSNEPDLVVQSPSVDDSTLIPGQFFLFSATVHNQGGAQAAATRLHVYRSTDPTVTRADTRVNSAQVRTIPASGTTDSAISLTAPSAAGAYYYGACVDAVSGESNTENNCSTAVQVAVQAAVSYWGAIATGWVSQRCGPYAWYGRWNRPDRATAISIALSACQADGLVGCMVRVSFDQCGALAIGGTTSDCDLFGGSGTSRATAERSALESCGARYGNCRTPVGSSSGNRASYCNTGAGARASADGELQSGNDVSDSPLEFSNAESNLRAIPAPP